MFRQPSFYLLIFCCFTFVCINGGDEDLSTSCDVELMVKRGTIKRAVPQQSLTVACPVKHCGEPQNVTWCKMLETTRCEDINYENVEITPNVKHDQNKLISFLTIKRISIHDDGLYRCRLKGNKFQFSHIINISVSELNQGLESSGDNADEFLSVIDDLPHVAVDDEDVSWLPYFSICVSIALLILTLTVMTLLSFHGWKRTLSFSDTNRKEMSTHVIPGLPKVNPPSTPVPQPHLTTENYIYSRSAPERPPLQPPPMPDESQPASANTLNAVYAVINHRQPGIPAREQHAAPKQDKKAEYAVINVP